MKEPSIKKNFIYSTAYQILSVLTPFITAPYISRVLGVKGIGIQSFTSSIQQYFLLFATLGTLTYGSREISMNRDDRHERSRLFWEIEWMVVCTTLASLAGWAFLCFMSPRYKLYYIVLTVGIGAAAFDISWFFNGLEQFKLTVTRNAVFKLLGIVLLFVFIKTEDDLLLYVFITAMTSLVSNLSLWPYLKKYLVKVSFKDLKIKRHFREAFIYFIPTIAISVYTVLDKTLLGLITGDEAQNGYYQQAEKIINIAKRVVFVAINSVVEVRNSYLYAKKRFNEIHDKIEKSFNFIFFMGFGCCFGIIGVAKNFVPLFFGKGYDQVVDLLYIFAPIIVIIGVSNCLGAQYYTPCGRRKESTYYLIAGSIVNVCLNLVLIPNFGAKGAAIASVIAESVISALYIGYSCGYGNISMLIKAGGKKLIAAVVMLFFVLSVSRVPVNRFVLLMLQVVVGMAVYGIALILLRDQWTIDMWKGMRKKKHG